MGGLHDGDAALHDIVDVLDDIAKDRGKSISQVAIAWLLARPTVASVAIGARKPEQLTDNLGAVGLALSGEEIERLDEASAITAPFPYGHQRNFPDLVRPLR